MLPAYNIIYTIQSTVFSDQIMQLLSRQHRMKLKTMNKNTNSPWQVPRRPRRPVMTLCLALIQEMNNQGKNNAIQKSRLASTYPDAGSSARRPRVAPKLDVSTSTLITSVLHELISNSIRARTYTTESNSRLMTSASRMRLAPSRYHLHHDTRYGR